MIAMIASTSHSSCCFFLHHQDKAQDLATEGLEEGRQWVVRSLPDAFSAQRDQLEVWGYSDICRAWLQGRGDDREDALNLRQVLEKEVMWRRWAS